MTSRARHYLPLFVGLLGLAYAAPASAEVPPQAQRFLEGLDERGVPEGHMLVDGDIIVPEDFFSRATYATNLWPDGIVPYLIHDNVTEANRTILRDAMDDWEAVANVQFVIWSGQYSKVIVRDSDQNSSSIGMQDIIQIINIHNWERHYTVMHEIAHTLGFWHEQSRMDRNDYVDIHFDRIESDYDHNFFIETSSDNYGPYDFDSVMHYGPCAFSTCDDCGADFYNCRTIEVLDPCDACWETTIGQRTHVSKFDVLTMSFLYPEPDWIFIGEPAYLTGSGTFHDPYSSFQRGTWHVPAGGTIWVQPGEYLAAEPYSNSMTIRAPLGGVLLSDAYGPGPGTYFDCCDPGPLTNGISTEPLEPVELR